MPGQTLITTFADPHVINFQGKEFFFYGEHNECFCLVTSSNFYLNVRLFDTGAHASIMTEAGIVVGSEKVGYTKFFITSIDTKLSYIIVKKFENDEFVTLSCDTEMSFDTGLKDKKNDPIMGSMKALHDRAFLNTGNFEIEIVCCDDPDHNLTGPPHLDIYYNIGTYGVLTEGIWPHGILGQSIDPEKTANYEGEEKDYKVSDLFDHNFKYNCFQKSDDDNKQWYVGTTKKSITLS